MPIQYEVPSHWIAYDHLPVMQALLDAKSAVLSLTNVPFQRSWAERLQEVQLKHEVAGTSRIEGAEFTDNELDAALEDMAPEDIMTRSQRQARAAVQTYRWISDLDDHRPIDASLILETHKRIVTGCDEDHCEPGTLRNDDHNVTFGQPRHRGCDGGAECRRAFGGLMAALGDEFRRHDILIQALALHYHIGAMHPFGDGNGRTSRAVEALMLQRSGLRDALFIALSNYYYDEKVSYLKNLAAVRSGGHDLTPFLIFGLKGIALQCRRLLLTINTEIRKALFRDTANNLFSRLSSPRKRVLAKRQIAILNIMIDGDVMPLNELWNRCRHYYVGLKAPWRAFVRDMIHIIELNAITLDENDKSDVLVHINLKWSEEITDGEFFQRIGRLPSAKTYKFLQRDLAA